MSDLVALPQQAEDVPWPTAKWETGALDPRVDEAELTRLLDGALAQPDDLEQTNAVLVVHRGRIVAERYADDVDEETTHISWSMAKSILHACFGVLVREGRASVEQRASDVPEWQGSDDPRSAITIDQLLQMRSGLRFLEDYVDGQSDVIEMLFRGGQGDVASFAAGYPLDHEPGAFFSYSSGTSNILAGILARAIGATPPNRADAMRDFLKRELFDPLGIRSATLRCDELGTWIASSYVFATARDFARFGLLYLRDGVWDGKHILPPGWVDYARRMTASPGVETYGYGAHFWVIPGSLGIFQAQGYNGQRLTIVPALDLVVVRLGVTPAPKAPSLNAFMKRVVDVFRPVRESD